MKSKTLEVLLIVGSVLLAFWFEELREDWDREERADAWQENFEQEVCSNLRTIRASVNARIAHLDELSLDPAYEFSPPFPSIRNSSWEVLRSSDIISVLPAPVIEVAARLQASQSQYHSTQPQFYLSANLRKIAERVAGKSISRNVLNDAYAGFIQLENEMIERYTAAKSELEITCNVGRGQRDSAARRQSGTLSPSMNSRYSAIGRFK